MRIGIDCRLWSESGVGRYIRNLIEQLQVLDKGNEYILFVLPKDYESIKYQVLSIKDKNLKVVQADIKWHSIEEQLKFPKLLNKESLDLVHFPYFSVPIFYKKPFVVTIHDLTIDHFPTGEATTLPLPLYKAKLFAYSFIIKKAVKKAKKIITVSNATKDEIIDHLKVAEDKVVVTYEGTTEISNLKAQSSNLKEAPKDYFLYVGNAYPHKNLENLLKAFLEVKNGIQNLKLILVGKEDFFYKRFKKKVEEMNAGESVVFRGGVNDQELQNLYRNAIALIIPSLMEGFGLPVLEAMANKCLVLCSDIPSFKEIASDCAIYFNPGSVQEIAEKMREVQFNDVHHYTGKITKGFERSGEFSWEKMAKETIRVYNAA